MSLEEVKRNTTQRTATLTKMSERLLTVEEFAERTRQHKETIRRQIRRGAIATIQTGRKHLIPESLATTPATRAPKKNANALEEELHTAVFSHLPEVPPLDLGALLKPPTPEEIARRLAALETLGEGITPDEGDAEELDLSGDRATLYGYEARDSDPVRYDREERAARLMEGHH